jgi:hypothetical protein
VQAWRRAAGITTGALSRSVHKGGGKLGGQLTDQTIAHVVKAHAERVGPDPAQFGAHSLRRGFLTSRQAWASIFKMMVGRVNLNR